MNRHMQTYLKKYFFLTLKWQKKPFPKESSLFKTKKHTNLAVFEAETTIKYEGYIQNEKERIEKNSLLDSLKIPHSFNFNKISGLSNESKERLCAVKPETLGQASRIFGIRPTDITLIGFHLQRNVSRETRGSNFL